MPILRSIATAQPTARTFARCANCKLALEGATACSFCGEILEERGGIVESIGSLSGRNAICARFYDSDHWRDFRPWEQLFLWFQGPGVTEARRQVLKHLPKVEEATILEIGIGDGENLARLSSRWSIIGIDIARRTLERCVERHPTMQERLVWAEAEVLPFADASFDAVYSVGGFNYFRDPASALLEMKRVVKPGGTVIAADEIPDLVRFAPGHALGLEGIDRFGLRLMGLDPNFTSMVFDVEQRVETAAKRVWPNHKRFPIWNRLGYCLVDFREDSRAHGHDD